MYSGSIFVMDEWEYLELIMWSERDEKKEYCTIRHEGGEIEWNLKISEEVSQAQESLKEHLKIEAKSISNKIQILNLLGKARFELVSASDFILPEPDGFPPHNSETFYFKRRVAGN
jgi:hypothetical protein|tara:strand:- start:768 stop:1115 length:348 start_codon:yes stop_codon:yes gene_type:complete